MSALAIVKDIEAQGLRFVWGQAGPSLAGDLGRFTPAHREALKPHADELKALVLWRRLQDEAEAKFGQPCARLYPFFANPAKEFWRAPKVRTPIGLAHLVQVMPEVARVAKATEVKAWRQECEDGGKLVAFAGHTHEVALADVWPPRKAPRLEATL